MPELITLKTIKQQTQMTNVQIRVPAYIREEAKKLAIEQSANSTKYTESDVYRTAIYVFLNSISTESRDG